MIVRLRSSRFGYMTTEEYHCAEFTFDREYMLLSVVAPVMSEEVVLVPQRYDDTDVLVDAVTEVRESVASMAFCTVVPGDDFIVEPCPADCKRHAD